MLVSFLSGADPECWEDMRVENYYVLPNVLRGAALKLTGRYGAVQVYF